MSVDGFKLVDLHIHTPHSACYIDSIRPEAGRRTSPEQIVQAAVAADLAAIAITDHNGVEMVDRVRDAAAEFGLTVFPGTEISTRGGHLLAIFDVDTDAQTLRELLGAAGFRSEQWGDGFQRSEVWMDEVMAEIAARGGLAIPAHVDREPRGFLASDERPSDKARIYLDDNLAALEVTDPKRSQRWLTGSDPRYGLARPCIQSSDAHAPEEIGRRPTLIRAEHIDLTSLREALADYNNRVGLPE
jgi:predicted metal-dependent phosphoesterase TrpH